MTAEKANKVYMITEEQMEESLHMELERVSRMKNTRKFVLKTRD